MKHFDSLADGFADALDKACEQLMDQGFIQAQPIKERIAVKRYPVIEKL